MSKSSWDVPGVAKNIDRFWDNVEEGGARVHEATALASCLVPGDILEVGCGSGRFYEAIRSAGLLKDRKYLGVDSSHEMLGMAVARYPGVNFEFADATSLGELQSENVVCRHVLQHVPDYAVVMAELLRVSRRVLFITSWFAEKDERMKTKYGYWDNKISTSQIASLVNKHAPLAVIKWTDDGALIVRMKV